MRVKYLHLTILTFLLSAIIECAGGTRRANTADVPALCSLPGHWSQKARAIYNTK